MPMFDEKTSSQLKELLSKMDKPINIHFFTQEFECTACETTGQFLSEIANLNDKIQLHKHDFIKSEMTKEFNINNIPAIVISDTNNKLKGVRFLGIPAGYEINSFIKACIEVSGVKDSLNDDILNRIKKIDKKIHIQVFVTLTCPYCPAAVTTAHRLAIENENIIADMVESSTFNQLAIKYNVSSVPKIVINEKYDFVGAQPINVFLDTIEKI